MPGHWVIIETGANQSFIFGTNKQRVNVGASALVAQVGREWAPVAAERHGAKAECVVAASGKAIIRVADQPTGEAIIKEVTQKALDEAPGLDVWGIVDPVEIKDDDDLGPSLDRAHQVHAAWRSHRPASLVRNPVLPLVQPCRISGAAANTVRSERGGVVSSAVDSAWALTREQRNSESAAQNARFAMYAIDEIAGVVPSTLDEEIVNTGWIAVVHADGNGIGRAFTEMSGQFVGQAFVDTLRDFSGRLDTVTREAFKNAVRVVDGKRSVRQQGWLLPLILGGDDVTFVCAGSSVVELSVEFMKNFMEGTAKDSVISSVAQKVLGQKSLSAAAGIAFVKPHHPFSNAYQLAEELCTSAKQVKEWDNTCSAFDFHVLHDSSASSLETLRSHLASTVDGKQTCLYGGPYVVPPARDENAANGLNRRLYSEISSAASQLSGPEKVLGGSATHELRGALISGGADVEQVVTRIKQLNSKAAPFLDRHLTISRDESAPHGADGAPTSLNCFSRVIDAMDLADVHGGSAHRRGAEAESTAGAR